MLALLEGEREAEGEPEAEVLPVALRLACALLRVPEAQEEPVRDRELVALSLREMEGEALSEEEPLEVEQPEREGQLAEAEGERLPEGEPEEEGLPEELCVGLPPVRLSVGLPLLLQLPEGQPLLLLLPDTEPVREGEPLLLLLAEREARLLLTLGLRLAEAEPVEVAQPELLRLG